MEKTSVCLSEAERRHLERLAEVTGRSQSSLIREAIANYDPTPAADRRFLLAGVVEGPAGSIADVPEEELLDGFGE